MDTIKSLRFYSKIHCNIAESLILKDPFLKLDFMLVTKILSFHWYKTRWYKTRNRKNMANKKQK